MVGKQEDVPVWELRVVVVECYGVKSRRKSGKLNSQRGGGGKGWGKLLGKDDEPLCTSVSIRRERCSSSIKDSHLLSFRRGVGNRGKNMAEPECLMESMIDNVGRSLKQNLVPSFAILIWDCLLESFQIVF